VLTLITRFAHLTQSYRRRTSHRQRTSIFTRLTSRVKSSENVTTRSQLPKADKGHTHPDFYPEESPSLNLPSSEAVASSEPSRLTSIIPDPARSNRFSLHGLATLLRPQTPQSGFKHRNRNTALISPSMPTLEYHSRCAADSEWEDLGDAEEVLDEVRTKAKLSDAGPHVAPGDVSALSVLEPGATRDLLAESARLARCRTESISTASSGIDIDALPSVASHLGAPFTPVTDQFPTSVWDEYQFSALRSSTDLVHGSLESKNALADLIDVLGLQSNVAEGRGLSNKAPYKSQGTSEVPLCPPRNDTLLDTQRPVTPPAEHLHPPSSTPSKYATTSTAHRPTLDSAPFSLHKEINQSFHPILDTEVKKFSLPVTQAPKSSPPHPHLHRSRDRSTPEPHGPRSNRKSFLPDKSSWTIESEGRLRKANRPSTAPQASRLYMDQPPPSLDSLLPGRKGKSQTSSIFPRFLSRNAKPPPPHWPPPQPAIIHQDSLARTPSTRSNSLKASRFEHRASRVDGSGSSWGPSIPPLPILTHMNA
jgi:hypothetical protein